MPDLCLETDVPEECLSVCAECISFSTGWPVSLNISEFKKATVQNRAWLQDRIGFLTPLFLAGWNTVRPTVFAPVTENGWLTPKSFFL